MDAPTPNSNHLSIYLIKPEFANLEDIATSKALPIEIANVGHFVFDDSFPHAPSWMESFFLGSLAQGPKMLISSAKGVLIVPIDTPGNTVRFALTFGVGRHLLKDGVFVERFGLKVVLNSVDAGSFRSIEKTTLSSVPKQSREQMSKDVTPAEFGIDIEQDLISSITATSHDGKLGKKINGRDALSVSVKVDLTNIKEFLKHCYERSISTDYKKDFDWIDQITEVKAPVLEDALNAILVQRMSAGNLEKLWMAVPEVIDWSDIKGFRYNMRKRGALHDDLAVPEFMKTLNGNPLTIEILKGQKIYGISEANDAEMYRWSAFRCIYAEVEHAGNIYLLNNGKWYEIEKDFTDQILNDFASIPDSAVALPNCTVKDEDAYNEAATQSLPGACCMDRKVIVHGGGHSKIEFCDVFTNDKRLIHVKKYGGSSVLSHLFAQGVVSAELFASDPEFRKKLNDELPAANKLGDPNKQPNPAEYEIVFGIISNSTEPLDIPFFSKVSLRNARRRLRGFGYTVTRKKILRAPAAGNN